MLAAYIIRKLAHYHKLSNATIESPIRCTEYRAKYDFITIANNHKIDQNYDLEEPSETTIPAIRMVNSIIHSHSFTLSTDESNTILGFLVTSDFDRRKSIRAIDLTEFITFMRLVGNDYPSVAVQVFDADLGDYRVWQGNGEPPEEFARELRHKNRARRD